MPIQFEDAVNFCQMSATQEQVRTLWAALKLRSQYLRQRAVCQFAPGQQVEFEARNCRWRGRVTKVNKTSVSVDASVVGDSFDVRYRPGQTVQWKVGASILRKVA